MRQQVRNRLNALRSRRAASAFAQVTRLVAGTDADRRVRMAHGVMAWAPQRVEAARRTFDGVTFMLDLRDNLQRTLFYLGHYERPLHDLLAAEIRSGDVFVDVGANIGVHALPIARRLAPLGGRAIAFEASSETADRLRRTAASNGIEVEVVQVALGRAEARATLHSTPRWDAADLGVRSIYGDGDAVEDVEIQPFDSWAGAHGLDRLDIVKIDVEGGEADVLAGMEQSLRNLRPRLVVVEVIEYFLRLAGSSSSELDAFMTSVGYDIVGPSVAEIVNGPTDGLWPNAIYRPRS